MTHLVKKDQLNITLIKMQKITFIIALFSVVTFASLAQNKSTLFLNGNLHPGNGADLPSAAIGVKDGKIVLLKNSLAFTYDKTEWDTIIDLKGKHVYPGFVAPNSTLGITEIDAVRATRDFEEVGTYNPHIRSQIAYNVESEIIKTVLTNGVLLCQPTPRGGAISGTSSVMALSGWNWEDATVLENDGVHLNWPNNLQRNKEDRSLKEKSESYSDKKAELYGFFEAAMAYTKTKTGEQQDLRYEAMRECFKGTKRVYFHANHLQQLQDIIDFVQHFQLPFPVIVGGYDSHLLTRKLKDAKIPVMLYRTHSLPEREEDPIDLPFSIAAKLQADGVLFCIQNEGDMEAMNSRNIPFLAGTAKAYGLSESQAVAAVSYNACKIMGIDKMYGSIEVGKSATLFVSDGNALDMRTNNVVVVMINGNFVSLENHQTVLYKKYSRKYETKQ